MARIVAAGSGSPLAKWLQGCAAVGGRLRGGLQAVRSGTATLRGID